MEGPCETLGVPWPVATRCNTPMGPNRLCTSYQGHRENMLSEVSLKSPLFFKLFTLWKAILLLSYQLAGGSLQFGSSVF
jgi:hypothetical protein